MYQATYITLREIYQNTARIFTKLTLLVITTLLSVVEEVNKFVEKLQLVPRQIFYKHFLCRTPLFSQIEVSDNL